MTSKFNLVRNIAIVLCCLAATSLVSGTAIAQGDSPPTKSINAELIVLQQQRIASAQSQIESVTERMKKSRQQMVELTNRRLELFGKQDELGISADSFGEIMKGLQANRVDLKIDLAGLNARKESMIKIRAESKEEKSTRILEPLMKVLELEKQNFADTEKLVKTNSISRSALRAAQLKVLEAEIRLAQARQPKTGTRFTEELLDISLDESEKEARLAKVEELLGTFAASRNSLEDSVQTDKRLDSTTKKLLQMESQLYSLQSNLGSYVQGLEQLMNSGNNGDDH